MMVYYFDIRSPLPENWRQLVTPSRQKRAERYLRDEDRLRCLGAGILLAERLGVSSDDEIIVSSLGKPCLRDKSVHFNLSHSGNLVVLAVSDVTVGVDIEALGPLPFEMENMHRIFSPQEAEAFRSGIGEEDFFSLWTGKEAIMKASGLGFRMKPSSFSVLPLINGVHRLDSGVWNMEWQRTGEYILCVAEECLER